MNDLVEIWMDTWDNLCSSGELEVSFRESKMGWIPIALFQGVTCWTGMESVRQSKEDALETAVCWLKAKVMFQLCGMP